MVDLDLAAREGRMLAVTYMLKSGGLWVWGMLADTVLLTYLVAVRCDVMRRYSLAV